MYVGAFTLLEGKEEKRALHYHLLALPRPPSRVKLGESVLLKVTTRKQQQRQESSSGKARQHPVQKRLWLFFLLGIRFVSQVRNLSCNEDIIGKYSVSQVRSKVPALLRSRRRRRPPEPSNSLPFHPMQLSLELAEEDRRVLEVAGVGKRESISYCSLLKSSRSSSTRLFDLPGNETTEMNTRMSDLLTLGLIIVYVFDLFIYVFCI
ncbi:hypothetical protein MPTK1_2g22850 [Marchantia polymorpha subsp. ruderalis]|uniref:Uncharacterized protein n=1 Tax=Marchantia polymorpha TaxID=3197 RepID=A0A2R6WN83_MARPO|nr:hypothetical protein MARPO_0072s0047 [Marchantia polymorpha]BBN03350.1 hypothetical protein Mp_2g22850 [Marchantia polymorpha subsp. ruderalis]|eukprot:PTQ35302.1 hypothetical protein MARPO_0072s0047 [Marchantia polymorpha]